MDKGLIKNLIIIGLVVLALFFAGRFVWRQVQRAMVAKTVQEQATGLMGQAEQK